MKKVFRFIFGYWIRRRDERGRLEFWQPIDTFDKSNFRFVLVSQNGMVRVQLWCPAKDAWEQPYPVGRIVNSVNGCESPDLWAEIPDAPDYEEKEGTKL